MRAIGTIHWPFNLTVTTAGLTLTAPVRAAGFLAPLGPVAAGERAHLVEVVLLTLVAGLPVLIGVPLIFRRYRRGNARAAYRPDWGFSRPLEFVMWCVPLAIVAALSVLLWRDTHRWAPEHPLGHGPLEIEAVGLNWKWLFLYPGNGVASLGELVLPAGRPILLKLTSDTVMQSFMVPSLAGQLYAMPGMVTRLNFATDQPGVAYGRNMQYSGNGFAGEKFRVRILDNTQYSQWLASAAQNPARLDDATYARLAAPGSLAEAQALLSGKNEETVTHTLPLLLDDTTLFEQIVSRYQTGKAIAPGQQPGTTTYRAAASAP